MRVDGRTLLQALNCRQQSHVAHRQQPLVKEEYDAKEGEQEAEAGQPDPDFCNSVGGQRCEELLHGCRSIAFAQNSSVLYIGWHSDIQQDLNGWNAYFAGRPS